MLSVERELLCSLLSSEGRCRVRVGGSSMGKAVLSGAEVTIVRSDPVQLPTGRLVAYWYDNRLMVHRLVHRDDKTLWVCGDSPGSQTHPVAPAAVLGTVVAVHNPSLARRAGRRAGGAWRRVRGIFRVERR